MSSNNNNCRRDWLLSVTYGNCESEFIMKKIKQLLMRLRHVDRASLFWHDYHDEAGVYDAKDIWVRERFNLDKKEDEKRLDILISAFDKIYTNGDVILSVLVKSTRLPRIYRFSFNYHQDDDGV